MQIYSKTIDTFWLLSLALTKKTMPMIIVGWDCRKKYPALLIEMGFNNTICKISRCCCGLLSGEWKRSLTIIFKFNYCLHFTTNFKANFALPASNLYKKSCQSSIFCTGRKITVLQFSRKKWKKGRVRTLLFCQFTTVWKCRTLKFWISRLKVQQQCRTEIQI